MAFSFNPLLTLVSLFSGATAGGLDAFQKSRAAYQQAVANEPVKAQLLDLLTRTRQTPNYSRLIESMSRYQGRALDAASAQGYSTGRITNSSQGVRESGIQRANNNSIAAQTQAAIIERQMQDEAQRRQLEAQILSSPQFGIPDAKSINPGNDAFLGFFAGGLGGIQSSIAQQFNAYNTQQQAQALLAGAGLGLDRKVQPSYTPQTPQAPPLPVPSLVAPSTFSEYTPQLIQQNRLPSPEYLSYINNTFQGGY